MPLNPLPPFAAWRHVEAREGFEVVFMHTGAEGIRFQGHTSAVEEGEAWSVEYVIELTPNWLTRRARVSNLTESGRHEVEIETDGNGHWRVNGKPAPEFDGILDVDLESSAVTNTFPIHRMALVPGETADAPAVYVRAADLTVMRLDQRYERLPDDADGQRYAYLALAFGADFVLPYDASGLVTDYPGLARRSH